MYQVYILRKVGSICQYFAFFLLPLCFLFFLMEVKKISCMLESFYIVLWEYIVAHMQIEVSKLQVLKDYLC